MSILRPRDPDARGYFGEFGGRFVPETLVAPVEALERAYFEARRDDPAFVAELGPAAQALRRPADAAVRGAAPGGQVRRGAHLPKREI